MQKRGITLLFLASSVKFQSAFQKESYSESKQKSRNLDSPNKIERKMSSQIELMPLPYPKNALEPNISEMTLNYHHGKHHAGYVTKTNAAIAEDSSLQGKTLEEIMFSTSGSVFNNAAQVWNHDFYWRSLSPNGGGEPTGAIADAIKDAFGDFSKFKEEFSSAASGHFGSGWAWLIKDADGKLKVVSTHDASNPVVEKLGKPIFTCDVWEHAYYIDYRNDRAEYLKSWWNLVNWDFANSNFKDAEVCLEKE